MDNAGKTDAEQVADAGLNLSERSSGNGSPEFHVSGETHAVRHALCRAGSPTCKVSEPHRSIPRHKFSVAWRARAARMIPSKYISVS